MTSKKSSKNQSAQPAKLRKRTPRPAPGRNIYNALVPGRISYVDLAIKISTYERSRSPELSNLKKQQQDRRDVDPIGAWLIGEAFRIKVSGTPRFEYASGLLSLFWFGNLADFCGVLACTDIGVLYTHRTRIREMLFCISDTTYVSPYDVLPASHDAFRGGADKWTLEHVFNSDVGIIRCDFAVEAERLNTRYNARKAWTLPNDLHNAITVGARQWLGSWANDAKVGAKNRSSENLKEPMLRNAHAVAATNTLDSSLRTHLSTSMLVVYFTQKFSPMMIPVSQLPEWKNAIHKRESPEATLLRAALTEQMNLQKPGLANEPTIDIASLTEHLATSVLKQFQSGKTDIRIKP